MIISNSTAEIADYRLAALHQEIALLEAKCNDELVADKKDIQQRLNFLQWQKETISVVYNWGVKKAL